MTSPRKSMSPQVKPSSSESRRPENSPAATATRERSGTASRRRRTLSRSRNWRRPPPGLGRSAEVGRFCGAAGDCSAPDRVGQHQVQRSPVVMDRVRRVAGGPEAADPRDQVVGGDAPDLATAKDGQHVLPQAEFVCLERPRRHLARVEPRPLISQPLGGQIAERRSRSARAPALGRERPAAPGLPRIAGKPSAGSRCARCRRNGCAGSRRSACDT
jgi:hypothetical protein